VSEFLAELQKLLERCGYGDSLKDMLRDRLVCGIADRQIQRRLLAESTLTLESAKEIALAEESAARNCRELEISIASSSRPPEDAVLKLQQQQQQQRKPDSQIRCFRCLSTHHTPAKCPFSDKRCFKCNRVGHTAKSCKSEMPLQVNQLAETEGSDSAEANSLYHLQAAKAAATKPSGFRRSLRTSSSRIGRAGWRWTP
jgi:hypothetical protein